MARAESFHPSVVGSRDGRGTVAFVVPGGGSLAATQIGMLRGLTEGGIVPDFLIGASAGALNAVGFAADPTIEGIDRLDTLWRALRRHDIAPLSLADIVRGLRGRRDWLVADTGLRRVLRDELALRSFEDLVIPAHVVVTELSSGQARVISHGDAVEALLASAALPGVFPPVRIAGRTYIDGGVSANAPVAQAVSLGATQVYVLPAAGPSEPGTPTQGALRVALGVLNQVLRTVASTDPLSFDWRKPRSGGPRPARASQHHRELPRLSSERPPHRSELPPDLPMARPTPNRDQRRVRRSGRCSLAPVTRRLRTSPWPSSPRVKHRHLETAHRNSQRPSLAP